MNTPFCRRSSMPRSSLSGIPSSHVNGRRTRTSTGSTGANSMPSFPTWTHSTTIRSTTINCYAERTPTTSSCGGKNTSWCLITPFEISMVCSSPSSSSPVCTLSFAVFRCLVRGILLYLSAIEHGQTARLLLSQFFGMVSKSNFGACTTEDIERLSISLTYFPLCLERSKPILLIFVFLYMSIRLGSNVNAGFFLV